MFFWYRIFHRYFKNILHFVIFRIVVKKIEYYLLSIFQMTMDDFLMILVFNQIKKTYNNM